MIRPTLVLAALLIALPAWANPWGATESQPSGTDPAALKPGQFVWNLGATTGGPIVVVVSLDEQRAAVYRNGIRVGETTVSTGRPGFVTPTGVFMVLQKDKDHHSKNYNNAAMPYTERLTWSGVALHAGGLPGYPSSHGCVHLPTEFARRLFEISPMGMTVVIADKHSPVEDDPLAIEPVDPRTGSELTDARLGAGEIERWTPEASPKGPISAVLSSADRRIIVFRNGIEIGRARLTLPDSEAKFGTRAFVYLDAGEKRPDSTPHWVQVGLPGHEAERGKRLSAQAIADGSIPPDFLKQLRSVLVPGATILATDEALLEETTGVRTTIVSNDAPEPVKAAD
jgi:L,D-transpeptidase catalytic domain